MKKSIFKSSWPGRKKSTKKKWPKKAVLSPMPTKSFSTSKPEELEANIEITDEFKKAFEMIEKTDKSVFLTGRAGTGKSTLLRYFRNQTKKKFVVLAPTGVAALNVKGQTVHSFFGFHPRIQKRLVSKANPDNLEIFKKLDAVVIDEISMVRADLLDCVDRALRLNRERPDQPFGGVQMIFIGDLFQLPPVVTREDGNRFESEYPSPYFFSAEVMREMSVHLLELNKVFRQKEKKFVELLNNVRAGEIKSADIEIWNSRHDPFFNPADANDYIVHLTTTNKMAKARNDFELAQLETKEWTLKADCQGELGDRKMPSEETIKVKEGTRIMFTTNDPAKRFVNGTLGVIKKIKQKGLSRLPTLEVELEDGEMVSLERHKWEIFEYSLREGEFQEGVVGSYSQYPIALAWAVTIHKAQGKTFNKVLVDVGWGAFAHGQMYVALSRCTDLKGITLLKPFSKRDVIVDQAVLDFMR